MGIFSQCFGCCKKRRRRTHPAPAAVREEIHEASQRRLSGTSAAITVSTVQRSRPDIQVPATNITSPQNNSQSSLPCDPRPDTTHAIAEIPVRRQASWIVAKPTYRRNKSWLINQLISGRDVSISVSELISNFVALKSNILNPSNTPPTFCSTHQATSRHIEITSCIDYPSTSKQLTSILDAPSTPKQLTSYIDSLLKPKQLTSRLSSPSTPKQLTSLLDAPLTPKQLTSHIDSLSTPKQLTSRLSSPSTPKQLTSLLDAQSTPKLTSHIDSPSTSNQLTSLLDSAPTNIDLTPRSKNESAIKKPTSSLDTFDFANMNLRDLRRITTLGEGGFGRVELVKFNNDTHTFALKRIDRKLLENDLTKEHVMNERNILAEVQSDFIVKLYHSFKDKKYMYMLMEVCLGGDLWSILGGKGRLNNAATRFYTGCVLEAFSYLHIRGIVYRDLKPDNILVDNRGYCKLADFSFAKKIGPGGISWSFCGTPCYMAPEIIIRRGHGVAVDYWALGVLMFRLLSGKSPFNADDRGIIYQNILRGIDSIKFPIIIIINKNARKMIKQLCRSDPEERLGYGEGGIERIMEHQWFGSFNWEKLRNKTMKAPFIPKIQHAADTSNFDDFPHNEDLPPLDDVTSWDSDL